MELKDALELLKNPINPYDKDMIALRTVVLDLVQSLVFVENQSSSVKQDKIENISEEPESLPVKKIKKKKP